jgi:gamma-glutamyltranspeptidase/glutathione hydrolase
MTVPAVVGAWAEAVARWGTKSFTEILAPTIDLAENGFALYESLGGTLSGNEHKFTELYPTTGEVYLRNGKAPEVGELVRNPDFGEMLRIMCRAEKGVEGKGRIAGIEAARDAFYKGEIAERIIEFISNTPVEDASGKAHTAHLSYEDMAEWQATAEEPVVVDYKGLDVYKCSSWTQGPVFSQQLTILEGYDLGAMGHNSSEYIHTLVEAAKLAFADREAYYGDPDFDNVPFDVLLSKDYAAARRALISETSSMEQRPGDVGNGIPAYALENVAENNRRALGVEASKLVDLGLGHAHVGDTTHLDAIDAEGNMVAATPSGGWLGTSPIVKGLGLPMGTRGQMFYLNPERPNALEPRKRPRATLTPSMVTKDGEPWMAFGTPGGDSQDQITLQFFLNYVEFGMNIQEAVDAPTFYSKHFPSSFYPRESFPGQFDIEDRVSPEVVEELRGRGHHVNLVDPWGNGKVMGVRFDKERGTIYAGTSPRRQIAYSLGW